MHGKQVVNPFKFYYFRPFLKNEQMLKEFENLREDEIDVLLKAPVYVAILIAGADGNIDKSERKEAIEIAHSKQSRAREQLVDYYKLV
ncbi:MAG: tellurite resistance protein, partial [Cyclobacteriaceae bacterium]